MKFYKLLAFVTLVVLPLYYVLAIMLKVQDLNVDVFFGAPESEQCEIPNLNPFDPSVMPHHRKVYIKCRNPQFHLAETRLNHLQMRQLPFIEPSELRCCYAPFLRNKRKMMTRGTFSNECTRFDGPTPLTHEFIKVQCAYKNEPIYSEYMSLVPPTNKPRTRRAPQDLNVVVLIIDGVSRMSFYRHLPKTLYQLRKMRAVEFKKFNRVGENTFPNVLALLAGLSPNELNACTHGRLDYFDACPFLWKDYEKRGYVTSYVEDAGYLDTFYFEQRGFSRQPVDHYWRPFNVILDDIKDHPVNIKNEFQYSCAGDKPIHVLMFEYCRKILERMAVDRSKFFAIFHSTSISHDDNAMLSSGDDDFRGLIKEVHNDSNTLLVVLSDHGSRYGAIRETRQGFLESNLPFLFIVTPTWFEDRYPNASKNLNVNAQRLVTAYDVHKTLKDLLHVDLTAQAKNANERGMNLFEAISKTRTCKSAGIEPLFCACATGVSASVDGALVTKAGDCLVAHLNELLINHVRCATLKLSKVMNARQLISKDNVVHMWLQIGTAPGSGTFEGVVQIENDLLAVLGSVTRATIYAHESHCINEQRLKMYCYCI